LDDVQWADQATLTALPAIAVHCRVAVALRTPHRLPAAVEAELRAVAAAWLTVPPLPAEAATALVRQLAPGAAAAAVADVVRRAGGVPLALTALARATPLSMAQSMARPMARRHPGASGAGGSAGSGDTAGIPLGSAGSGPSVATGGD